MSRKTRQTVTMIALCVLLVAAGIGYYVLIRFQSSDGDTSGEEGVRLYEMTDSEIVSMQYKNQKADMKLVKKGNVWKMAGDEKFPLNQNKISLMVDEVAAVSADQVVTEQCDDLAEYQLDEPDLTIEVEDRNGNTQKLVIGMESMSGGGRYAYCGDSSKVYLLSTSIYTSFDYSSGQLMKTAEFPTVTADYVTGLRIRSEKGKNFEVVYDEKNKINYAVDGWVIRTPYRQPVAASGDQLRTLFEGYSSLSFEEGVSYHASAAELKKYGLQRPSYEIILDYFEVEGEAADSGESMQTPSAEDNGSEGTDQKKIQKKLRLSIGKRNREKTGYYAMIDGDDGIYLLETSKAESLVQVTPLEYVYPQLYVGNLGELEAVELTYQGKSHRITLTRKKAGKNDDTADTDSPSYTVKIDGKKADAVEFANVYSLITSLSPSGEIDSKVKPQSQESVAEMVFHEKKRDVEIGIYPYDGNNFYRIKVDGLMEFVVDMRNVDRALEGLIALG